MTPSHPEFNKNQHEQVLAGQPWFIPCWGILPKDFFAENHKPVVPEEPPVHPIGQGKEPIVRVQNIESFPMITQVHDHPTIHNCCLRLTLPKGYERKDLPGLSEWVKALESGTYPQGLKKLRHHDGTYCCLGVLSEVQGRLRPGFGSSYVDGSVDDRWLAPSNPCFQALSTSGRFPEGVICLFIPTEHQVANLLLSLASVNDLGFTFHQIAQIIKLLWKEPTLSESSSKEKPHSL